MKTITYAKLTSDNFTETSLDTFIRHQEVTEIWQNVNGKLVLRPIHFVEEWELPKLRQQAQTILQIIKNQGIAYGAFLHGQLIGFSYLADGLFGRQNQYIELAMMQVSCPFRRQGIGKMLFTHICMDATRTRASKLYISAHSARETIAFYHALGCVEATEINPQIAANEPFDIQLEYQL